VYRLAALVTLGMVKHLLREWPPSGHTGVVLGDVDPGEAKRV